MNCPYCGVPIRQQRKDSGKPAVYKCGTLTTDAEPRKAICWRGYIKTIKAASLKRLQAYEGVADISEEILSEFGAWLFRTGLPTLQRRLRILAELKGRDALSVSYLTMGRAEGRSWQEKHHTLLREVF